MMVSEIFTVEQIHCAACETAIRKTLTRMDGVRDVDADSASNQVRVRFDETAVGVGQIVERLSAAGYPVRP